MQQKQTNVPQSKKLSVISIIVMVIGICIGSGIFYKNSTILQNNHGSILLSVICWVIVGLSSLFIAISLIEVCSIKHERSALGILAWVKTFNHPFVYKCSKYYLSYIYWPTLLYGLSIYFVESICLGLDWPIEWYYVALISLLILTWFTFVSGVFVKAANITSWIISCVKFLPVIFAIVIGYIVVGMNGGHINTGTGPASQGWLPIKDTNKTPLFDELNLGFGMVSTFPAILFAINGFQFVPGLQHEMAKPKKLSFAMNVGLIIVLVVYVGISVSLMIGSDGTVKGLKTWMNERNLDWLYIVIQLLISIGVLSVINGSSVSATMMYEDLILHNELILSHKFNKRRSGVYRPIAGAIYSYIVILIIFAICTVAGIFFVDDSGISFLNGNINTSRSGGLFTLTNVVTNWGSLFFVGITVCPIVGCLINRRKKKIPVQKNKLFVFSAIVSIILIVVTVLDSLASCFSNPFIVGSYLSDGKYTDRTHGNAELVTTILTLVMLLINVGASLIPTIVETNRKFIKGVIEREKGKV